MTEHEPLVREYETALEQIEKLMGLFLSSIILSPFAIILVEEDEWDYSPVCTIAWLVSFVLYAILLYWFAMKRSETVAMWGCILAWSFSLGLLLIPFPLFVILLYIIIPVFLTWYIWRMLRLIYLLAKTSPPTISESRSVF